MYSVKLDETNHYTGSYATVGKITGGIDIESLPPETDLDKALCYKYETHDVQRTQVVPVTETNATTGEITQKLDENGNPITEEQTITVSVTEWFLDETKYAECIASLLEEEKTRKIDEIKTTCQSVIYAGTDVVLSDTETKHFGFTLEDQSNIKALYDEAKAGATVVPYHIDNEFCRLFTVEEITKIYKTVQAFKIYNTTLCNYIKMYIKTLTNNEDIAKITFDVNTLSDEYKTNFNTFIASIPE